MVTQVRSIVKGDVGLRRYWGRTKQRSDTVVR
jgi:hypothetical protein